MPRRIYTYDSGLGWTALNVVVSIGAFTFALGTLLTLFNFVRSQRRGAPAPPDPWGGDSLEWSTTSPPPEYNFAAAPVVSSRHPLWDEHPLPVPYSGDDDARRALGLRGAREKEMTVTEGLDALPQESQGIPEPTLLPFWAAVAVTLLFVALLVTAVLVAVVGVAIGMVAIVLWLWRTDEDLR